MRFKLKKTAWMFVLAFALVGTPHFAAAQSEQGMEHGHGHDKRGGLDRNNRDSNDLTANPNYQRGVRQGQYDGSRNRNQQYRGRFSNDYDRDAYRAGYDKGFQDARAEHASRDNGAAYRRQGPYGQNGQYSNNQNGQYNRNNQAAQMGAQDGMSDGRRDRQTGHSNRPTEGDNYKNALRGYNSSLGGETAYKAAYRQAYGPAYQQGYSSAR